MRFDKFLYFLLIVFFTLSCSSKKNILYLQDIESISSSVYDYKDAKLKIDDILKIQVYTANPELSLIFNKIDSDLTISSNVESMKINGYLIDNDGNISFPVLGKIKLVGLTRSQSEILIRNLLIEKKYLTNPTVEVRVLNYHFSILGEVNGPGTYNFLENNMNVLKAISMAGDLTINGKRDNLKLIRSTNGKTLVHNIDLTSARYLSSEYFQIQSGDILIVNPNNTRIKNAGIIGNSGTLLSLLSFILSSVIVISN